MYTLQRPVVSSPPLYLCILVHLIYLLSGHVSAIGNATLVDGVVSGIALSNNLQGDGGLIRRKLFQSSEAVGIQNIEDPIELAQFFPNGLALCFGDQEDATSSRALPVRVTDSSDTSARSAAAKMEGMFRCYVPISRFPRKCVCLRADCGGTAAEKENCRTCLESGGVYESMSSCMSADETVGIQQINPASEYPDPSFADEDTAGVDYFEGEVDGDEEEDPRLYTDLYQVEERGSPRCPHAQKRNLYSWCDPATWGGSLPNPQGQVVLPLGKRVLLEPCAVEGNPVFTQILIPQSSELIFANANMNLTVSSILVRGALRIGGPRCRVGAKIRISFPLSQKIEPLHYGIIADRGVLEMHGVNFKLSWTRLAATAKAGDNVITIQEQARKWRAGQQIMIATSIFKDEIENQNEVATIKSVSGDGKRITLTKPLVFEHYGGKEYQSEVALLSRNIIVEGSAATEMTKIGPQIFIGTSGRVRGVLAYRFGQQNVLGAYPFHFHMLGNAPTSYFTDNTVYRSYYRCFTVHGTNNAKILKNVAFHVDGNCFYLEDGVEEGNTFQNNFAGYIHPIGTPAGGFSQDGMTFESSETLTQPADAGAAGFYISNPNNDYIGNAASGGVSGFSMPVLQRPIGLSRIKRDIIPSARPFGNITQNTAHSSGYFSLQTGGCMYFGGNLQEQPLPDYKFKLIYNSGRWSFPTRNANNTENITPQLTQNKVWLCNAGLLFWGERLDIDDWKSYDSIRSLTLLSRSIVRNGYANAKSANLKSQFPGNREDFEPQAGFQLYDTGTQTILAGMTYENFKYQPDLGYYRPSVLYSMTHSDQYKPEGMTSFNGFKYINVDYNAIVRLDEKETGSSRMFNFLNQDGTVVLKDTSQIVGGWPTWWDISQDCNFQKVWNTWVCSNSESQQVARIDLRVLGFTKERNEALQPSPENYIGYVSQFGSQERQMTVTINEGITGVTGPTGWYVSLDEGSPNTVELWLSQLPVGRSIIFSMQYPPATEFNIQRIFKWYSNLDSEVKKATSLEDVLSGDGLLYYFDGENYLYLKLVDPQLNSGDLRYEDLVVYGTRWWDLHYSIKTNRNTQFTPVARVGPPAKVPAQGISLQSIQILQASPFVQEFCTDRLPNTDDFSSCDDILLQGLCNEFYMIAGPFCSLTCGRCINVPTPRLASQDSSVFN